MYIPRMFPVGPMQMVSCVCEDMLLDGEGSHELHNMLQMVPCSELLHSVDGSKSAPLGCAL